MLDLFRRKQRGLKLVLWVVIIGLALGMALLFVDVGGTGNQGFSSDQAVAVVEGQEISALQFRNTYYNIYEAYRRQFDQGGRSSEILKFFKIENIALDRLVKDAIVRGEARRLGLEVSQQEILEELRRMPGLSENGRFIGRARLEQVLRANNSSLAEFETSLRTELLTQKLRNLLADGVLVAEEQVREDYIKTSQRTAIEYVAFKAADYVNEVPVTEADLRSFFDTTKEQYRVQEQRRIRYLQFSPEDFRAQVQVTDQEIQQEFNTRGDQTEVRARHILFNIPDPSLEAEIRTKAQAVLDEARQGKDFAELAKKHSQDPGSGANGGDLGYFKREMMVPEFSEAAFSLTPGSISDLVRTQYGFHIIRVEDKRTGSIDQMRGQLESQLRTQKAENLAQRAADEAAARLKVDKDIQKVATDLKLQVRETGFFSSQGTIPLLGEVGSLQEEVFGMKNIGESGRPHKTTLGFVVPQWTEKKDPFIPELAEVRDKLVEAYRKDKSADLARIKAQQFAATLGPGADLAAAAAKIKNKVVKTEPFTRSQTKIDDTLLQADQIAKAAFELPIGKFSEPVKANDLVVVFRPVARDEFDEKRYTSEKPAIRERLENAKKSDLFQAYLDGLDKKMRKEDKIQINQPLIDRIIGS